MMRSPDNHRPKDFAMPNFTRRRVAQGLAGLGASLLIVPRAARAADGFPLSFRHAFGETLFTAPPQRIVTIGWMTQDAVVALGTAPLGVPEQAWGGDENKLLPWLTSALQAQGMALPERINFDSDIPYEQVLALQPDAILAFYSGLTQEQYDRITAIAPVAAYASAPWAGNWHDITLDAGRVLGKPDAAQGLIDMTNGLIAAAAAAHPEFKGRSFTFASAWVGEPGINVYSLTDPRVQLVGQLGLEPSAGVKALSQQPGYFFKVSFENLSTVDADVVIFLDEGDADSDAIYQNEAMQRFAPIAAHRMLRMTDKAFAMSMSAPSVLGIPWMLERFVPELAKAVAA